jgi:hypothetical protein
MKKALNILVGLYTYWGEILELLNWPVHFKDNPILFLNKIYFGTDYISDIYNIINYFELSSIDSLTIVSKIITKNNRDMFNLNLMNSMDIKFLEDLEENQLTLITDTLMAFDNIMKAATILLWDSNVKKIPQAEASQKL